MVITAREISADTLILFHRENAELRAENRLLRVLAHQVQRYISAQRGPELHGLTDIWLDVEAAADALPPIAWPE